MIDRPGPLPSIGTKNRLTRLHNRGTSKNDVEPALFLEKLCHGVFSRSDRAKVKLMVVDGSHTVATRYTVGLRGGGTMSRQSWSRVRDINGTILSREIDCSFIAYGACTSEAEYS